MHTHRLDSKSRNHLLTCLFESLFRLTFGLGLFRFVLLSFLRANLFERNKSKQEALTILEQKSLTAWYETNGTAEREGTETFDVSATNAHIITLTRIQIVDCTLFVSIHFH